MAKGNSTNETTNLKGVEVFITQTLLKGENVIIPGIGHLEVRSFGERRTVLFKPTTETDDSFLRVISPLEAKGQNNSNAIYNLISIPLKEEKIVNLPSVGLFRPVKRENGEIHVSFIPSAFLRSSLNKKEGENNGEIIDGRLEDINEIKMLPVPSTNDQYDQSNDVAANNIISDNDTDSDPKYSETRFLKKSGIQPKQNSNVVDIQKDTQPNKTLEQTEDKPERKRSRINISGIVLAIVVIIFLIVIGAFYIHSRNTKSIEENLDVSVPNESISLPALAEQHYGHSAYWVYIYEANMDKLNSPINVSKDVSLVFPDLKTEYDVIDVNDSMEIKRANIRANILVDMLKVGGKKINTNYMVNPVAATATTTNKGINNNDTIITNKK